MTLNSTTGNDEIVLSSGGAAGEDITFLSTVNNADNENLRVDAGADGDVTFTGAVGDLGIGDLAITNAADVTFSNTLTADSFTQDAGTGTTAFNGLIDLLSTFSFTGENLTISGAGNNVTRWERDGVQCRHIYLLSIAQLSVGNFTQDAAGASVIGDNIISADSVASRRRDD